MMNFWKKSGQKEEARSKSSSPTPSVSSNKTAFASLNGAQTGECGCDHFSIASGALAHIEDEGFDLGESEVAKQHSQLSKTLEDVLDDKQALVHFAQYLECHGALRYLHCWMDIEQFKVEVQKLTSENIKEDGLIDTRNLLSPLSCTKVDHDSLSVSTDCDSYTGDSSSLCDYVENKLTADVKNMHCSGTCDNNSNDTSHTISSSNRNPLSNCSNEQNKSPTFSKNYQSLTDDALKIFKMYISLEATESINCSEEIRKEVIENICDTSRNFNCTCFEKVEHYLLDFLQKQFFRGFLESDYFFKHQIDVLTSGNVVLDDILYNETALFYFMEFLEQENSRNLLEFWIAATNFQMQLNQQKEFFDPAEAQSDAVVLYDRYFSLQAHCPLGFSDKVRFAVEQTICGENGVVLDCFHLPLKLVEQVLEKNYLKPFIASNLFYKYLSELINSVHSNSNLSSPDGNKYAASECGSEKSTNSTFLAMQMPLPSSKRKKGADMNIDTRQLYDPDSLWRRRRNNRLSCGRVTALGRYETDFEPEPDRKSSSRLKNVVKKIVNIEEDKKKEEMAWQVAEMIVKDITNITLHEQRGFHS